MKSRRRRWPSIGFVKLTGASWASRETSDAAVDVLLAVEPLQVGGAERRVGLGVGHVQVHLVGVVEAVGVLRRIGLVVVGWVGDREIMGLEVRGGRRGRGEGAHRHCTAVPITCQELERERASDRVARCGATGHDRRQPEELEGVQRVIGHVGQVCRIGQCRCRGWRNRVVVRPVRIEEVVAGCVRRIVDRAEGANGWGGVAVLGDEAIDPGEPGGR